MNIKLNQPYLSINHFDPITLADFSILTGINGSGKTHLLKAIDIGIVEIEGIDKSEIVYYNYNEFTVLTGNVEQNASIQNKINYQNSTFGIYQSKIREASSLFAFYNKINTPLKLTIKYFLEKLEFNYEDYFGKDIDFKILDECKNGKDTFSVFSKRQTDVTPKFFSIVESYYLVFYGQSQETDFTQENIKNVYSEIQNLILESIIFETIIEPSFDFDRYFNNEKDFNQELSKLIEQIVVKAKYNTIEITFDYLKLKFEKVQLSINEKLSKDKIELLKFSKNIIRNKSILDLNNNDFETPYFFLDDIVNEEKDYLLKKIQNSYNKTISQDYGRQVLFLEPDEFIKQNGLSPVEQINTALSEYDCNGYFLEYDPNIQLFGIDRNNINIQIKLKHKEKKYTTTFDELSSGEKTLIALSLFIYKTRKNKIIPRVLLLDEIDSSLHPSIINRLLNVIKNLFIKEQGLKVIMATHSPTTVALSPEESIFGVNSTGKKIEKITKDKALKVLTSGVPSFSVNYENRRQVFVESSNDVKYYEKIYQQLSSYLNPEISLSFISSGESKTDKNGGKVSNCEQVRNITEKLSKAGNRFVFGIIDWDYGINIKNSNNVIKVLGNGNRHSIENYLLDPLLLGILLLREKIVDRKDLQLEENETFIDLRGFCSKRLQIVVDFVSNKVSEVINPTDNKMTPVKLLNGIEINIPQWYLHHHGHELENKILNTFPKLGKITRGNSDSALKNEILDKVIDDIPNILSIDFLELFKSIQEID